MPQNLYIIGNGFDLHHGIKSAFSDFKHYLTKADSFLLGDIEKYLPVREDWADLEMSFAYLDTDYIEDSLSCFLPSYSAEDWSDSGHHDYEYEVDKLINNLSTVLKSHFIDWILKVDVRKTKRFCLPSTAKYLSFNYTPTLETVYSVPEERIQYIHNKAGDQLSDLILGHGWHPSNIVSRNHGIDTENYDVRIYCANETIDEYFSNTFKPTEKIIKENINFFNSLRDITQIYVMGHSLAEVDIAYFRTIIENIDSNRVQWKISYYRDGELMTHYDTMKALNIGGKLLEFKKLENF
jgi:hypothetical protein